MLAGSNLGLVAGWPRTRAPGSGRWAALAVAWLLGLILLLPLSAVAAPAVPHLKSPVTDEAGLLSAGVRGDLERSLLDYQKQTGHQFAFLSVGELDGTAIEDFGQQVASAWRLGDEKRDDGLILIVAREERAVRIEVGYGLEGVIPDALAARVIRQTIVPAFREGRFDQGVRGGFEQLMRAAEGEALGEDKGPTAVPIGGWIRWLPIVIVLLLYLFGSMSGPRGGRRRLGGFGGIGYPPLGGFGGSGRGFGGGGFGGMGGGFGGGGASGRW